MINHIAVLVRSVERSAGALAKLGCAVGPREEFEGEGTAEIYVGKDDESAKLLLLEAVKPGAYTDAMKKRGPGLHHVAVDVTDLESFVAGLAGSGWYLHPKSLATARKSKTAWLARPGTAMLIEVQQRKDVEGKPPFVTGLEVPLNDKEKKMVAALGAPQMKASGDGKSWLVIGKHRVNVAELL